MANLSANRPTDRLGGVDNGVVVNRIPIPIADNVHIYEGALVQVNASGYATPAGVASAVDTSAYVTVGRAYREYDNTVTGHTPGALTTEIEQGCFSWDNLGTDLVVQGDVGHNCYAYDDHTVAHTNTSSHYAVAGKVLAIFTVPELGSQVWVQTVSV